MTGGGDYDGFFFFKGEATICTHFRAVADSCQVASCQTLAKPVLPRPSPLAENFKLGPGLPVGGTAARVKRGALRVPCIWAK